MTYRCSQTVSALNGITDLQVDAHCALVNGLKLMANCRYGGAAIDMTRNGLTAFGIHGHFRLSASVMSLTTSTPQMSWSYQKHMELIETGPLVIEE